MSLDWLETKPIEVEEFGRCTCGDHTTDPLDRALISLSKTRDTLSGGGCPNAKNGLSALLDELRAKNRSKRVIHLVSGKGQMTDPPTADDWWEADLTDFKDEDKENLAAMLSFVSGCAVADASLNFPDQILGHDQYIKYQAAVQFGFSKMSESTRERVRPIYNQLQSDLADMAATSTNPFSVSQKWSQWFDNLKDWEFARLARTEAAFAQEAARVFTLKEQFDADDTYLQKVGAFPPVHPNCLCTVQPFVYGGRTYLYLDTQLEPCVRCNDLADEVIAAIEGAPPPTPPKTSWAYENTPEALIEWLDYVHEGKTEEARLMKIAIQGYTQSFAGKRGYRILNDACRDGGSDDLEIMQALADLDMTLAKAPKVAEGTTVWRGMHAVSEKWIDRIEKEGFLKNSIYTSTSVDRQVAVEFAMRHAEYGEHDGVLFQIKTKRGVYIEELTTCPGEEEVLLPRNSEFKVTGRTTLSLKHFDGYTYEVPLIMMEEI